MIDINLNKQNQQTIKEIISISGIGLHSGKQVEMKLVPAEVDQGVKFIRSDKSKDNVFAIFRLGLCFFEKANITNNIEEKKNAIKYFEMAYGLSSEEPSIQRNLIGIYNIYGLKNKAIHLSKKVDGVFNVDTLNNEIKINC